MLKKPTRKAYEKHVSRVVAELRDIFILQEYWYNLCFVDEIQEGDDDSEVAAKITIDSRYLNFTIHVTDVCWEFFKNDNAWLLANTLVHEFAHVLVEPVWKTAFPALSTQCAEFANDIKERQTQRICNVVLNLIPRKVWEIAG